MTDSRGRNRFRTGGRPRAGLLAATLAVTVALLLPPVLLPLVAAPSGEAAAPAACCCGDDGGACLCALLAAGGCGDGLCSLDRRPSEPRDAFDPAPVLRLGRPASPPVLATPIPGDAVAAKPPHRPDGPSFPPDPPPPRA